MSFLDDALSQFMFPEPEDVRPLAGQTTLHPLLDVDSCASSVISDRVRDAMDEKDSGCIVTNIHRHTDRRAHIINIQRGDDTKRRDIEAFLYHDLGISPVPASLDYISNLFWLDSTLHSAFDQYHLFAITVSKKTGLQIKQVVEDDLACRQGIISRGYPAFRRAFYSRMSPIKDLEFVKKPELQVVPLLPHQLLPHGFPLIRRRRGTTGDNSVYDIYVVADDGQLRSAGGEHEEFPIETQETTREGDEVLNVWFLLINAASKFRHHRRRYGLDHFPDDIKEVINLTIDIVGLIYKQVEVTTDLEQTAPVGGRTVVNHDHSEGDNFDGQDMTPEGPGGSPAGDLGYRYSIAGFQTIKDPEERALYANKWLFGDEIDAVHDELFGRQPTATAYSSNSGMMQQWAANVSKEEGKYES